MQAGDKYSERVEVVLRRSRIAETFVGIAAIATLAVIGATPLPWEARVPMVAWVAVQAWVALHRLHSCAPLALDASGAIAIGGVEGRLREGSFVAPWLAIVRWRPAGARLDRTLMLTPDRMPAEDFRRIRVMLRWTR